MKKQFFNILLAVGLMVGFGGLAQATGPAKLVDEPIDSSPERGFNPDDINLVPASNQTDTQAQGSGLEVRRSGDGVECERCKMSPTRMTDVTAASSKGSSSSGKSSGTDNGGGN